MIIQRGTIKEMKSSVAVQLGKFTFTREGCLGGKLWTGRDTEGKESIWHTGKWIEVLKVLSIFSEL